MDASTIYPVRVKAGKASTVGQTSDTNSALLSLLTVMRALVTDMNADRRASIVVEYL